MTAIQSIVGIKNAKLFPNDRDTVEVKLSKDKKVKAAMSYFDENVGYDIRISPPTMSANQRSYIKLSLSLGKGEDRKYFNGLLNPVKKEGSAYSFAGSLDVEGLRTVKVMVKAPVDGAQYHTVIFSKAKAVDADAVPAGAADSSEPAEGDPF